MTNNINTQTLRSSRSISYAAATMSRLDFIVDPPFLQITSPAPRRGRGAGIRLRRTLSDRSPPPLWGKPSLVTGRPSSRC